MGEKNAKPSDSLSSWRNKHLATVSFSRGEQERRKHRKGRVVNYAVSSGLCKRTSTAATGRDEARRRVLLQPNSLFSIIRMCSTAAYFRFPLYVCISIYYTGKCIYALMRYILYSLRAYNVHAEC